MKQTLLLMTFLFFGTSLSYAQCPDHTSSVCDGQRVSVDVDTLPFCDVGSTSIEGDINQNLDCEDITGLNCFEFMFFRAENSTTESFTFDVGQGQGCTGELDASYFVYDGSSCQPLSSGGSQTNITFDFPLGVNEIYIYLCINSNAQVTMCNVCRERPPCTVDVACQQLEDITGNYCSGDPCNIPAPTTVVSEVFAQNELCDFEVIMESSDAGETDCVDSNGNNQIEVTRTYTLKYFDLGINDFITIQTCQQNIILTQENCCVAPSITCPSDVTIQCDESSDPVFTGEATSIEGCGDVIISYVDVETPQDCINETIITRTWTATDENQDSQQCVQIITVVDTEAPELSGVPSDIVVACDAIPAVPTVTATDNCTAEIVVEFEEQFPNASCLDDAQIIQTWTATDECGNTVSQSRTITLIDDTPPVITCPEDLELQCFSQDPEWDISPEALNSFASAIEACSGEADIDFSDTTTGNECGFTVERTWSATDACGNQSTCVQTITIIDEIPPVLFNVPVDVTVECDDIPSVPDNIFATDECDELVTVNFSETTVAGDCANAYTIIRTWTAIDACDNQTSASQNISVDDNSAPVAPTAPGDLNLECASDMPPPFDLTAVDNCDGDITVSPSAMVTPGDCTNQFTMIRTWTFTDLCGNTSSVSQTINVNDDTAPIAPTAPANLNLQCASDVPPPVELTAVDNCDGDITVSPSAVVTPGDCANQFTMVRTWTFTDVCGNTSSVSQTINVNDDTAPVAPTAPADLNLQCASDVPPPVELTAVDNCDGDITVSPTTVTIFGECNNRFSQVRTWTFVDGCGNVSSVSQTINVNDDTAPVAPTAPVDLNLQCASDVPPPVQLTAVDNCDGDITVSPTTVTIFGECNNQFSQVRTWTFVDGCGNLSSVSQTINVNDDTAPVAPTAPADLNLQCASDVPDLVELTAVDNCDGDITVSPTSVTIFGPCNNQFSQVRTWTFTDVCGNTSSVSQTINVNDDTPPEILCPSDVVLNFGPDLDTSPDATGGATATDNCGGVTVTFNDVITPGNCDGNYTITRTWTATDSCGNTSNCDQLITVGDDSPPTITCPADVDLECAEDLDTSPSATGVATAIDLGDPNPTITFSDLVTVGDCAGNYVITRTWRATDNCGNMDECVQLINVTDTTPPNVIDNCPTAADFGFADVQCQTELPTGDEAEQALVQNNLFSFFEDNCGGIAVNISDPVLEGDTCSGTATYTIDVFDACGNLNNNCSFTINWADTTPPNVIDNCPTAADFGYTDVQCQTELPTGDAAEQAFVQNNISAFYDDNCSGIAEVYISDPVLDGDSCSGTATYTIDLFDACGNLNDNCSFTINWADTTPPNVIDNCPTAADFGYTDVQCQTELPTGDEAEQAFVQNNISTFYDDNCSGIALVNISDPVLDGDSCSGTATYVIDLFDACGNLNNSCSFTINWADTTPPQIPSAPGSLAICEGDAIPASENLTAYDACQGEIIVSPIETIEPLDNGYNIVRNYTADDGCGNSSVTTTQIIFVNSLPTITPNEPVCDEVYGSYSVEVQVSEGTLISSAGNVTDNGNGLWSIDDIPNGQNIILTATTGTNCTTSIDIVAPKCVCIELELTYTDVSCFGLDDGTISVEYVSPGATVTVNGMPYDAEMLYEPGVYTVTAYFEGNDNPECIISEEITIEEPVAVDVVVSSTNITCYGANDGTITIESISEGAFYTIKKNGYGADLSGQEFFGPGTYIVEANLIDDSSRMIGLSKGTDAERANNPCEDAVIVVISEPDPFECTITRPKFSKQLNCSDTENNQLYANTIGGEGPLEYAWSLDPSSENNYWELPNSTSDSTLDFLPGIGIGHFYLTVTDANGCMTSCEILFKSSCTKKDVLNRGEFNRLIVFDLYPNPSEGKVNVKLLDAKTDKTTVEVFNLVGTLMFSQDYSGQNNKDMVLDLGNLPSQVYYVKVSTSYGSQIKKLIIDK